MGKFLGLILLLALGLTGCAGLSQDIQQEIRDDSREARQKMAERQESYKQNEYYGFTSKDSDKWNSTDWSLWMDTHGGGR